VILRATTRVCHSYTIVQPRGPNGKRKRPKFERDIRGRVMIPANARPAHKRLRQKLTEIQEWNETHSLKPGRKRRQGTRHHHIGKFPSCTPAKPAPKASAQAGVTYPLPMKKIAGFIERAERAKR